ncbi:MAG: hypothetical protein OHK0023_28420 [Anaerolineae bacterium]
MRLRRIFIVWVVIGLLWLPSIALAQRAPTPNKSIDAAFADVNATLGTNYTRTTVNGRWYWDYISINGQNLDCPTPPAGVSVPIQSAAYVIGIRVNSVGLFEYRATPDESVFFRCVVPSQLPAPRQEATFTPQPTFAPLPATAEPTLPPQPTDAVIQPPTATVLAPTEVAGANVYTDPMAYIGSDGEIYINTTGILEGGTRLTNNAARTTTDVSPFFAEQRTYGQFRWAANGAGLLYTENQSNGLYVALSGAAPRLILEGLAPGFNGVWSPDGTEIGFVVATPSPTAPGSQEFLFQLQALPLNGGEARVVGTFTFTEGCSAVENLDPADRLYEREVRAVFQGFRMVEWLPNGIIHTMGCNNLGVARSGLDGIKVWEVPNAANPVLSPDGTKLAAKRVAENASTNTLLVIDVATGAITNSFGAENVDLVAWSADSQIVLFSTAVVNQAESFEGNPSAAELGTSLLGFWPLDGLVYDISIKGVMASGGEPVEFFRTTGRAISSLTERNNQVIFSFVGAVAPLIDAINQQSDRATILAQAPKLFSGVTTLPREAILSGTPLSGGFSGGGIIGLGKLVAGSGIFTAVAAQ